MPRLAKFLFYCIFNAHYEVPTHNPGLTDLSFEEALTVHRVCYFANEDLIHLEITNYH